MRQHRAIIIWVFGIILFIVGLIVILSSPKHKSNPYLQILASNEFYIDGRLVFNGDEQTWSHNIKETHTGENYSIEFLDLDQAYYMIDGQYYFDEGNGCSLITASEEDLYQIEEMFARMSVISNYDFSEFVFNRSSSMEILEPSSGELILCDYEEYSVPDSETETTVRLYYHDNDLYAIQAKADYRYLFYVSTLTKQTETI